MDTALISDAELLAKIEVFCKAQSIKPSTFGRMALGDGSLISNLKAGRSLTLKNAARIAEFMATYPETKVAA